MKKLEWTSADLFFFSRFTGCGFKKSSLDLSKQAFYNFLLFSTVISDPSASITDLGAMALSPWKAGP